MATSLLFILLFLFGFIFTKLGVNLISDRLVFLGAFSYSSSLHLKLFHSNQILSRIIAMLKITLFLQRLVQKTTAEKDGAAIDG